MVRSSWVYRQLRRFRAGIEGCISMLFGAHSVIQLLALYSNLAGKKCLTWKGWEHFQQ